MAGQGTYREVRGVDVRCTGPEGAPHPPRRLDLPSGETVICPDCGMAYCRASWWNRLSGAAWPKADEQG